MGMTDQATGTLAPSEARRRYDLLVADGTHVHSADTWRTMAELLVASSKLACCSDHETALLDRAADCQTRARQTFVAANYSGCVGAGFRSAS